MLFEVNIGLNVNGSANSHYQVQQRAYKAVALLRRLGSNALIATCRVDSQYEDSEGNLVLEPTLYAKLHADSTEAFFHIAKELEQDCIAVYNPRAGKGDLIGPNASKWGEFNSDYFNRPSETTQLDVAA